MQSPASLCIHGADFPVIIFLWACVCMDVPFTRSKNHCSNSALLRKDPSHSIYVICYNLLRAPTVIRPSISPPAALQADMPFLFIECVGLLRMRMLAGPRLIYLLFKLRTRSPRARRTHLIMHVAYLHLSRDGSLRRPAVRWFLRRLFSPVIYHIPCFAASLSIIVAQQYSAASKFNIFQG